MWHGFLPDSADIGIQWSILKVNFKNKSICRIRSLYCDPFEKKKYYSFLRCFK